MALRHIVSGFALAALLLTPPGHAATSLVTRPALTFFSTVSENPFARLEASAITPRFVRHGPFVVPAPGVAVESPTLALHDEPCTPDDWTHLLEALAKWQNLPSSAHFVLTLPEGRTFVFSRSPQIGEKTLSGFVRPLTEAGGAAKARNMLFLRIAHDGADRFRIDLRPLPATRSHAVADRSAPAEPNEPSASTADPSEPAASTPSASSSP